MVETILYSGFFWGLLGIAFAVGAVLWSNKDEKKNTQVAR